MGSEKCASWQKITRDDDVTAFLGFSTLMGINVLATLHGQLLAVRQDPEIHPCSGQDLTRQVMGYLLLSTLHRQYHLAAKRVTQPRSTWPRLLLIHIDQQCRLLYNPHREVAVDEAMIKVQGVINPQAIFFFFLFMPRCTRHRSMPNSQRLILRLSKKEKKGTTQKNRQKYC